MKIFLTSLVLCACVHPAFAQGTTPRFIPLGDVNTSPVTTEPTDGGAALLTTRDLVFSGSDSEAGEEIWIKDSNTINGGLFRVDFRPGGASSSPREFAPLDGRRFSVVVEDGITGAEVVVMDSYGSYFPTPSGQDLCPGRDHAAPRLLGRVSETALYILDDGADPFGRPGESVWKFSANNPPLWLDTFKAGSVRQPLNGTINQLYFVGQRWNEAEISLFRVSGLFANHAELLCVLGDSAVAEPLPDKVYAVTPRMVCYRGFNGSQPTLKVFRTNVPGNVLAYPLGPVTEPGFSSNGYDRICYAGYDPVTGIEPWMIADDFTEAPLTPQLVVDSNPSTLPVSASSLAMQGNILYFETGDTSRVLKFVDTGLTDRVAYTVFSDSEFITRRLPLPSNKLAYVLTSYGTDSLVLYNTTSRTWESLAQDVKVKDLWARGDGLCAILKDYGNDMLCQLVGTSWQTVQSFTADSARRLQITGGESSSSEWLLGKTHGNNQPQLFRYEADWGGSIIPVSMIYQGPSNNASSHPADFHEINGHLFLTAVKGRQRVLYHSPDGARDSLQPVPPPSSSPDATLSVKEVVRLADQLFVTSAADGTLNVIGIHPSGLDAGKPFSVKVLDGATPVLCDRVTVAAGKVFFVQVGATTETLRYVNPDLSLGTVQVFQKPTTGQAISLVTGTPERLFFTASANPSDSTSLIAFWSTTGSGMPEQRMLYSGHHSPRILGIWGGLLVFWTAYHEDRFEVFTWSGLPGQDLVYRFGDQMDRRPESSHTPGMLSGVEFDGHFAFCDRSHRLMVLGPSGLEYLWYHPLSFVCPECLATLNGKLVWKAYSRTSWRPGMRDGQWFCWSAGDGFDFIGYTEGAVSPLLSAAGRVWSTAGWVDYAILTFWNGLNGGLQEHAEPVDPFEALGDVSMGTYRGRLLLSARPNFAAHSGYEPTLLLENSAPKPPVPLKRTGARPGQPFTFTYEDLLTWGITDAEGDSISLAALETPRGLFKVNGSPVSGEVMLNPGDLFEWTPPASEVGDVPAFQLRASDTWDATDIPVTIRVETPHDEWTRQHFTPQQLADPLVSGPHADADGDGVSNALEFLFGRLPLDHENESGWTLTSTTPAAGQRRAVFTFNRLNVLPQGTTVRIEQSEDLQSWDVVAEKLQNAAWTFPITGVSVEEVALPDGRVESSVAVEEGSSLNRFLRLRVVLP